MIRNVRTSMVEMCVSSGDPRPDSMLPLADVLSQRERERERERESSLSPVLTEYRVGLYTFGS